MNTQENMQESIIQHLKPKKGKENTTDNAI